MRMSSTFSPATARLPSGLTRQYSLCGDPQERRHYTIAVRPVAAGRGGSAEIHGTALVGRELAMTGMGDHFPLCDAGEYLLIAGGIGITPLVPMARVLAARRAKWAAVYCGRGAATMPFRPELAATGADRVRFVDTATQPRPNLKALIGGLGASATVYCCGPHNLLDSVTEICETAGIRCETEHFGAATRRSDTGDGEKVELEQCRSETTAILRRTIAAPLRRERPGGGWVADFDAAAFV
ncbi:ferredoxin reductase [Actinomadura sp. NTSP31]|uniref:ferredoxin reductase n=1 Tax=Actinomadura sp. NTSP31 TaxID=1735447 RepID=UPI0035BF93CA